jgi:carbonic anhydrase/acetyltransferase-like protein (isoleucine patch superfamily)
MGVESAHRAGSFQSELRTLKGTNMLYALGDQIPEFRGEYFVADNAVVIGSVIAENNVGIWFGAVLRGDNDRILIGENSNVQENCVLHTDPGYTLRVGRDCTVGHCVMLHGCTIGDGSLIGINSVILNGATIGKSCLIGANALVAEGKTIPDRSLVVGSPGKVIRELTDEEVARLKMSADNYVERWKRFKRELRALHT